MKILNVRPRPSIGLMTAADVSGTDWALGTGSALSRDVLSEDSEAEPLYREAIQSAQSNT